MKSIFEKYRPKSFDEMVGNAKAVAQLRRIAGNGIGGRAIWLSGPSATGKTSAARILAATLADGFGVCEVNAGELTADMLAGWIASDRIYGWGDKGGKVWIVNEAHGLNARIIRALLTWLEELPSHCAVIFTTTLAGEEKLFDDQIDASPLLSRCLAVTFTNQGIQQPFAERARQIAQAEGLDGQPIEAYMRLAKDCKGNMRMMLQRIESGELVKG